MKWEVLFHPDFRPEFFALPQDVQDEFFAEAAFVELFGPSTKRPHVDKLHGSAHANMKELRYEAADGEWRVAFAFNPKRQAVMLVAGDKTGQSEKKFYERLIEKADKRFKEYLAALAAEEKKATLMAKENEAKAGAKDKRKGKRSKGRQP